MIKKGMILAAGLGTRLRPLTNTTPKPLVEVCGKPVIEYNIHLLKSSGVKDVIVNLHHLPEKIRAYLGDGKKFGVNIQYSYEQEILGTAGGIKNAEKFFAGESFVTVNTDLVSNVDLKLIYEKHLAGSSDITMVLRKIAERERYTPLKAEDDKLVDIGSGEFMYTGIQVINPIVLAKLPPAGVPSELVGDLYRPMLKNGETIGAYIFDGFWTEIGTIEQLKRAQELVKVSIPSF